MPHVPGPVKKLRLATSGLSKTSEPVLGGAKAAGLKIRSPERLAYGLPITRGRKPCPLKSPIASTKSLAMFPGQTGSQLLHVMNGVKPVPDFANIFHVNCQPPATASAQ